MSLEQRVDMLVCQYEEDKADLEYYRDDATLASVRRLAWDRMPLDERPGCTEAEFRAGCEAYQRKLFQCRTSGS